MEDVPVTRAAEDLVLITIHDLEFRCETEITLERKETVRILKFLYAAERNFGTFSDYSFTFNGRALEDHERLENIRGGNRILFASRLIPAALERTRISVDVVDGKGNDISKEFLYPTKTFEIFKTQVRKKQKKPPSYYTFFFDGKIISDNDTGHDLGIGQGDIIVIGTRNASLRLGSQVPQSG